MIEIPSSSRLGFTREIANYYPSMTRKLGAYFTKNQLAIEKRSFENFMPLYIVQEAPHALLVTWLNGDNWQQTMIDLMVAGSALTQNPDTAGSNSQRLGVIAPFIDARQDKRTRKPVPEDVSVAKPGETNKVAIVKSQFVLMDTLAKMMSKVSQVEYLATLDFHSFDATKSFEDNGIQLLNFTANHLFLRLLNEKQLLRGSLDTVVCTTDLGALNRAHSLSQILDVPLAIIHKQRIASEDGTHSTVKQQLIHGNIHGKRVIIPDDMISSGSTSLRAVELVLKLGAKEVLLFATQPVFVENYYANLQRVLKAPQVKLVATTNSLPLEERQSGSLSVPYIGRGESRRQVEVIDISPLLIQVISVLLSTQTIDQARQQLGEVVMENRDSYELFSSITGQKLERPKDVGIYRGEGKYELFEEITKVAQSSSVLTPAK